jgi:hypothetical protein
MISEEVFFDFEVIEKFRRNRERILSFSSSILDRFSIASTFEEISNVLSSLAFSRLLLSLRSSLSDQEAERMNNSRRSF